MHRRLIQGLKVGMPTDDATTLAGWVAAVVAGIVAAYKIAFNLRQDSRTDKEGTRRLDLIASLSDDNRSQSDLIDSLYRQLDEERKRRREAEDAVFACAQREKELLLQIRNLMKGIT